MVSLSFCAAKAPRSRPISVEKLAVQYAELLQRPRPVPPADIERVLAYISERALVRKYAKRGPATVDAIRARLVRGEPIETQDWFLSDPTLPSATGAEKDQSFQNTVTTCAELGLLADKTLTVESGGDLLVRISEERGLLSMLGGSKGNPFQPDPGFVSAAYFLVLKNDFLFQREFIRRTPETQFSFYDFCSNIESVLTAISAEIRGSLSQENKAAQRWLDSRLRSAMELNRRRLAGQLNSDSPGPAIQTLYRPFEDLVLPRLEFLVDFGVLRKPQPARYLYQRAPAFEAIQQLLERGTIAINEAFFGTVARVHNRNVQRANTADEVLEHLTAGFQAFKGLTAYAPIVESTVYANLATWSHEPWRYVEITESHEALRELTIRDAPRARIISDRFRQPHSFSILN